MLDWRSGRPRMATTTQRSGDDSNVNRIRRAARHHLDNIVQPNDQEDSVGFMKIPQAMGKRANFIVKLRRVGLRR